MSSPDAKKNSPRERRCSLCQTTQTIVTGRPRTGDDSPKYFQGGTRVLMVQLRLYATDTGLCYGPRILLCEKCVQDALGKASKDTRRRVGVSLLRLLKNVYQSLVKKVLR